MSEFSNSFHVRSTARRVLAQGMRRTGLRGVLFPPKNGWCTVVPFEGNEPTLENLSLKLGARVLHYLFAEDHGWAFALADHGEIVSRYEASWEVSHVIDDCDLSFQSLQGLLLPGVEPTKLESALLAPPIVGSATSSLAYQFAKALGLPVFEWLSPSYVTADFKQGALPKTVTIVGAPDPDPELPQPAIPRLDLPRTDLSAREAVEYLAPHILAWDPSACADAVFSAGDLQKRDTDGPLISSDGRNTAHGAWIVRYKSAANGVILFATLHALGIVSIRSEPINASSLPSRLPEKWLDSTQLIGITEPLFEAKRHIKTPPIFDRVLRLTLWGSDDHWTWMVNYFCFSKGLGRWDLSIQVDALTGDILGTDDRSAKPVSSGNSQGRGVL